jgi:hypothetical protein
MVLFSPEQKCNAFHMIWQCSCLYSKKEKKRKENAMLCSMLSAQGLICVVAAK